MEMVNVMHKPCGRTWKVSKNCFDDKILYCPTCKQSKGFIIQEDRGKEYEK